MNITLSLKSDDALIDEYRALLHRRTGKIPTAANAVREALQDGIDRVCPQCYDKIRLAKCHCEAKESSF